MLLTANAVAFLGIATVACRFMIVHGIRPDAAASRIPHAALVHAGLGGAGARRRVRRDRSSTARSSPSSTSTSCEQECDDQIPLEIRRDALLLGLISLPGVALRPGGGGDCSSAGSLSAACRGAGACWPASFGSARSCSGSHTCSAIPCCTSRSSPSRSSAHLRLRYLQERQPADHDRRPLRVQPDRRHQHRRHGVQPVMNRIDELFAAHASRGPHRLHAVHDGRATRTSRPASSIVKAMVDGGADGIELGIPFSDPLADGPTIQRASYAALQHGTTPQRRP